MTEKKKRRFGRQHNILQVAGAVIAATGFFIVAVWLGLVITGLALLTYGVLQEASEGDNA